MKYTLNHKEIAVAVAGYWERRHPVTNNAGHDLTVMFRVVSTDPVELEVVIELEPAKKVAV